MILLLLLWQILAILVSGTGAFSQLLASHNVNIPTTQSCLNYFLLSFHYLLLPRISTYKQLDNNDSINNESLNIKISNLTKLKNWIVNIKLAYDWWKYALLALADVEGNFFLVLAYQYTTISSVQLLDCFTIPVVMILSKILFSTKYNQKHIIGCLLCILGLILLVVSDILTDRYNGESPKHKILGDILVLIGCIFYGISNVGQELIMKQHPASAHPARCEYLAMLGVWGTIISILQMFIIEYNAIQQVDWKNTKILIYLFGYASCLITIYTVTPILLQKTSAVLMNLSFLTADFWSILIALTIFKAHLHFLYFIAFAIIIIGLFIYNVNTPHNHRDTTDT